MSVAVVPQAPGSRTFTVCTAFLNRHAFAGESGRSVDQGRGRVRVGEAPGVGEGRVVGAWRENLVCAFRNSRSSNRSENEGRSGNERGEGNHGDGCGSWVSEVPTTRETGETTSLEAERGRAGDIGNSSLGDPPRAT